ncbi:MAG: hypothetical protein Q7S33_02425 [Nanoarchaeota archaeon]|nr:hypothetical protein [Nanoarchaeota archaeon]
MKIRKRGEVNNMNLDVNSCLIGVIITVAVYTILIIFFAKDNINNNIIKFKTKCPSCGHEITEDRKVEVGLKISE